MLAQPLHRALQILLRPVLMLPNLAPDRSGADSDHSQPYGGVDEPAALHLPEQPVDQVLGVHRRHQQKTGQCEQPRARFGGVEMQEIGGSEKKARKHRDELDQRVRILPLPENEQGARCRGHTKNERGENARRQFLRVRDPVRAQVRGKIRADENRIEDGKHAAEYQHQRDGPAHSAARPDRYRNARQQKRGGPCERQCQCEQCRQPPESAPVRLLQIKHGSEQYSDRCRHLTAILLARARILDGGGVKHQQRAGQRREGKSKQASRHFHHAAHTHQGERERHEAKRNVR